MEMIDSVPLGGDRVKCTPLGRVDELIVVVLAVRWIDWWAMCAYMYVVSRRNTEPGIVIFPRMNSLISNKGLLDNDLRDSASQGYSYSPVIG